MTIQVASQAMSAALADAAGASGGAGAAVQPGGAEKFQALMNDPQLAPPASAAHADGGLKQVEEVVAKHDVAAQKTMDDMKAFSDNIGAMNPLDAIGEASRVSLELATVNFDFQAKMGIVDASKSAAETLMKNQ